jgi:flagellar biosynthesis protein FlhF
MKIRTFTAPSVPLALRQVHDDLGDRAVILNTRTLPAGGDPGLRVEVTAALDEEAMPASRAAAVAVADEPPSRPRAAGADLLNRVYGRSGPAAGGEPTARAPRPRWGSEGGRSGVEETHVRSAAEWLASLPKVAREQAGETAPPAETTARPAVEAAAPRVPPAETADTAVVGQLRQLEEAVHRMARQAGAFELPLEVSRLGERLRRTGLERAHVDACLQAVVRQLSSDELDDREAVARCAATHLAGRLPGRGEIRIGRERRVVGLVGPSGAGKTTTAARIAAGFARRRKSDGDIVLVHADARRVGGLAQARAFADLIDVPLEQAYEPADMAAAAAAYGTARLMVVDVGGCGPHEREELAAQCQLLDVACVDEVHVVVDGLTGMDHVVETARAWAEARPEGAVRLLVTKMDQTVRPGAVVSAAIEAGLPLSYLTISPAAPGGIHPGKLEPWIEWMVGLAPRPFTDDESRAAG